MAAKLVKALRNVAKHVSQVLPFGGKDWNDTLKTVLERVRADKAANIAAAKEARQRPPRSVETGTPRGPR